MSRPWIVIKYGGTSVATAPNWGVIVRRTKELLKTNR
jgi:aspartokinase